MAEISRIEDYLYCALSNTFLDALLIAMLQPRERRLAVGERYRVPNLATQSHRRLYSAITTTHDQNVLVDVVVRFNQPVHDFG